MKPTRNLIRMTVAQIECCLGLVGKKQKNHPNIDRAIKALEDLRESLKRNHETPLALIGLSGKALDALENAGVETVEQVTKMDDSELLSISDFGPHWLLEVRECVRVFDEFQLESFSVD